MIIYIASYPRSGNFWMQNLLANQFKRITTNIHEGINNPNIFENWKDANKKYYNIDIYSLEKRDRAKYGAIANWIVGYKAPEDELAHKAILPGCLELLNRMEIRNILASDQELYFLKTHLYPHSRYLDGEYVIQIVRNPGACLWSYYNFKRDLMKKYDEDLSSLIHRDFDYGSWSQYHLDWANASDKLGPRYLLVRYEDLFDRELEFCKRLQPFLDLQVASTELRSFDFYHRLRPTLTRAGKVGGWEKNYSKDQLRLLWKTHCDVMTRFGYQEPNYALGMEEVQH